VIEAAVGISGITDLDVANWVEARFMPALAGLDAPWAAALRRFHKRGVRAANASGYILAKDWHRGIAAAMRACGVDRGARTDRDVNIELRRLVTEGRGIPTMRGADGRLMPDPWGLGNSGAFGKRSHDVKRDRDRAGKAEAKREAAAQARAGLDTPAAQRLRRVLRLDTIRCIEVLERAGRLHPRDAEMAKRSVNLDAFLLPESWGSRAHHRALTAGGFAWSRPMLVGMVARAREALETLAA
jgi:hypothetical protein